jgi:hypothetical protein
MASDCWILQSFHGNGTPKLYGGDEIYVEWIADVGSGNLDDDVVVTGVALVTDQQDGTYALDFVTPPLLQLEKDTNNGHRQSDPREWSTSASGRLNVYYDYTCGIGSLVSPLKDRYARAGEVHVSFTQNDIPRPPIRHFDPPNRDQTIDLSTYDHVYGFGDSIMLQLVRSYKGGLYWHPNLYFEKNVEQALSDPNETASLLDKLRDYHGAHFRNAATANESVAVIVGSATWDVMRGRVRPGFRAHLTACREFVQQARAEFPYVDFYWKSPSAIVLHRRGPLADIGDRVWLSRSRYISDSVPRQVYLAQKDLMRQINVPFLDLFDTYYLSAPWTLKGDCRHYDDRIASLLLSYYWPGLNRDGAYTK